MPEPTWIDRLVDRVDRVRQELPEWALQPHGVVVPRSTNDTSRENEKRGRGSFEPMA